MSTGRGRLGAEGEEAAVRYLRRRGYRILARNYKGAGCEIDVVARDGGTLVFVEVKTRSGEDYGHPGESVTMRKQRQIGRAALAWLAANDAGEQPMRFDVVAILWKDGRPEIELIKNAFESH